MKDYQMYSESVRQNTLKRRLKRNERAGPPRRSSSPPCESRERVFSSESWLCLRCGEFFRAGDDGKERVDLLSPDSDLLAERTEALIFGGLNSASIKAVRMLEAVCGVSDDV